ncbi:MAG TPA: chromosome segregation protein SMC [Gaiellales bacterium]|jgi:chromosome segregation protein|nr:chromosome segregation protein SMC [Gaiellales bacterium]
MYLKSLRIRGFKSFPHGIELRFQEGIAVIIGPNGSGKSNIADALQWAMGVHSPAQLRAAAGQDVLFSGSDSRPPSGVCEVELVLDNECGTLPLEFGEVSVMRRLHRESEGEYYINRSRVRRLDVLELLADTGLGREMHSVIGQGGVEEILVSKPHERRRFVEEAAGLGKYQRRRTRAEAKLARVSAELERARDLEREVRARLRPLAMQATAAERAAKLAGEIVAGRVALLGSEVVGERLAGDGLRSRLETAAGERDRVEARLAALAQRRATAEGELTGLATAQERAAHSFYAFETSRDRLAAQALRLRTATAGLERAIARRASLAERLADDASRFRREAAEADSAAQAAADDLAAEQMDDSSPASEASARAEAALAAAMDARRALAEAQGRLVTARGESEQLRTRTDAVRQRMNELAAAAEQAATGLAGADADARTRASDADGRERAADEAVAADSSAAARAQEAAGEDRARRAAVDELEHRLRSASTRLAALERALDRGEGLSPAAQALKRAGAALVVAGVEARPGYERAVAAALGWRAGAVVAERIEDAVDLLHGAEGELAVVLASSSGAGSALPPSPGARPLAEVVKIKDGSVARLVEGVWLVDDLTQVGHGIAVTVAGEGIDADRGELWRTADAGEAAWLAARSERERASAEAEQLEGELTAARSDAGTAASAASAAAEEARTAGAALTAAREAAAAAVEAARQAAARRDALADELARTDAARDLAAADLEAARARLAELDATTAAHAAEEQERRSAATAADEEHARLEQLRRELAEREARAAARRATLEERLDRHRQDAARLGTAAEEADAAQAVCAYAIAQAQLALPEATSLGERLTEVAAVAERLREPARAGVDSVERRAAELAAELQACAEQEAAEQSEARRTSGVATELEIALARGAERIAELERRRDLIAAEYDLDPSDPEQPLPPEEAAGLNARLERLERRRESLGAVNPLAAEEYEAEKQRSGDLVAQCDDLERSLRELRSLIRDLTQTIDRRFAETFAEVQGHFRDTIGTLFPGGSGRLRLTDDVVSAQPIRAAESEDADQQEEGEDEVSGEPGIELEVRPAGKRIESLTLLSGGEKALTAIAFLFALMLTKPSPFYVLDEVEAALDDANIERFLTLLRESQKKAQFIVITHQRRTMEVADVLYGVSMAGDGESRVLSRRMPAEADLHHAVESA